MSKVIDSFIFYNELPLLNMRLHELNEFVDYFVLVEATRTFSGEPKPLYYQENKDRFSKFQDKIIHVIVDDLPEGVIGYKDQCKDIYCRWDRQHHHRNSIFHGVNMVPNISDDDFILVSDVDEIPNPKCLSREFLKEDIIYQFCQRMFYYNFSCEEEVNFLGCSLWKGTMGFSYKTFKKFDVKLLGRSRIDVAEDRSMTNVDLSTARKYWYKRQLFEKYGGEGDRMKLSFFPINSFKKDFLNTGEIHGGWHCSYFGDVDKIINKMENLSEQRYNRPRYKNRKWIEARIDKGADLYRRARYPKIKNDVESDTNLPKYKKLATLDPFKYPKSTEDSKPTLRYDYKTLVPGAIYKHEYNVLNQRLEIK